MKSKSVISAGERDSPVEPTSVNPLATSAPGTGTSDVVDLDFTAAGHLYATHPLHAFAARCPPPLARWAIERYSNVGDVVLDPMCGSGTTLVEATLAGRKGWGADIDPLARLIAEAKSRPTDAMAIGEFANGVERQLVDGVVDDGWRPEGIDLSRWFRADVAADLARLRVLLSELAEDDPLRAVTWTAFSSLIVARTSVANARDLVHSRHHFQVRDDPSDVPRRFVRSLRRAAKQHAEYGQLLDGIPWNPPRVVGPDARALPVEDGTASLVFTSPPYCSALDYTRAHMFAVAWMPELLGCSADAYRHLGRLYVGSERAPMADVKPGQPLPPLTGYGEVDAVVEALSDAPKRAWIVHRYFCDMEQVLAECARVVRPGGRIVLVVCPSNIRKVPVPTHQLFAVMAGAATSGALTVDAMHERTIHDHRRVMPYLEASFGARMRTEYVLVLAKTEGGGQSTIRSFAGAASIATSKGLAMEVNDAIA
jgi:SAM-dependent methyltransferase